MLVAIIAGANSRKQLKTTLKTTLKTKRWRRYVLGNLEFFMHFLPVTVSNKLFATNQSSLTL